MCLVCFPTIDQGAAANAAAVAVGLADDAASAANLMLYHRRGASGAGQDNDVISTIFYRGKNDAGTPEEIEKKISSKRSEDIFQYLRQSQI